MTTTLPISNDSMARAMLRRTLREAPLAQQAATLRAIERFAPSRQRRGPVFRAKVRLMDPCLGPRVLLRSVTGQGKAASAEWVFWEVLGEIPRPVICAAALDGRHLRLEEAELVRVSRHALQRLFQRLRTDDPALRGVLPAALRAGELSAKARAHRERYRVHLHVPTGEGEAVLVWEDGGFLIKTWLHHGSMSEERAARWGSALADSDRTTVAASCNRSGFWRPGSD